MKEWVEEFLVKTVVQTIVLFTLCLIAESIFSFYHNDIWYYICFAAGMATYNFISIYIKHHRKNKNGQLQL